MALPVDHDVLGFEVTVDDAQPVGFRQALADLLADEDRFSHSERADPPDQALQVLAGDIFHRDVVGAVFVLAEVVHSADVLVGNFAGQLELIPEALDDPLVLHDLRLQNLERHDFFDLFIKDFIDAPHPPFAQVLDDLVPLGKCFADGELFQGNPESLCVRGPILGRLSRRRQLGTALPAKMRVLRILGLTLGSLHLIPVSRLGSGSLTILLFLWVPSWLELRKC
jgi:hypothetical protein